MDRFVEVAVKSAWWSKINWNSAVTMLASVGVFFGVNLPESEKLAIIVTLNAVSDFLNVVLRTWFTTTVTPAVANKVEA